MESYIVRIYREEKMNPHDLIGIVEEAGVEEKKVFRTLDELWNILKSVKNQGAQNEEGCKSKGSKKSGIQHFGRKAKR
jgi:hypothetical protein